jgi:hypothetical protein
MDSASFRLDAIRVLPRTPHAPAAHFPRAPPLAPLATGAAPHAGAPRTPGSALFPRTPGSALFPRTPRAPPFAPAEAYVEDSEEDVRTSAEGGVEDALLGDRVLQEDEKPAGGLVLTPADKRGIALLILLCACMRPRTSYTS